MAASILVVEDEPAIQELVSFTCTNNGYAVRRAESARAAQDAIRHELPDLVILDWMLPDRAGIELLRDLRTDERTKALPIILLTAKPRRGTRSLGLTRAPTTTWSSRFPRAELVSRLRAVFRRRAPEHSGEALAYGSLSIDPSRHEVRVGSQAVKMGLAEFKLLKFLVGIRSVFSLAASCLTACGATTSSSRSVP